MQRFTSPALSRVLLAALLLWLAAQSVALVHELDVDQHQTTCDWCLTHASLGHAAAAMPPLVPPATLAVLLFGFVVVAAMPRLLRAYHGRAPPR